MHFRGQWDYQLDERNRVPVPPKARPHFANGAVLTQGPESCIEVYTEEGWQAQADVLEKIPMESTEAREAARAFFGSSHDADLDGQGRVAIPGYLVDHAGLTKEVKIVGRSRCLEIWDKATFEAMKPQLRSTHVNVLNSIAAQQRQAGLP
jgi:MraZ protein